MVVSSSPLSERPPVRTHVITGFLGTGKTTLILHLLKHRPAGEKWAVLVNEFGEVGVDGAILAAQTGNDSGIAIREVPGGCLCCTAGLPFQIGLNWLIAREKPDVLLIEPTGLGHPAQLLETLRSDSYKTVLTVGSTVTVADPRHISNPKYRQHGIYSDQLAVADVLVANKTELAAPSDRVAYECLVNELDQVRREKQLSPISSHWVTQGQVDQAILAASDVRDVDTAQTSKNTLSMPMLVNMSVPLARATGEDFRRADHQEAGMYSVGWLIRGDWVFELPALRLWLSGLDVARAKAVLLTTEGERIFNLRDGALTELAGAANDPEEGGGGSDSRLEIILEDGVLEQAPGMVASMESGWLACRATEED